MLTGLKNWVILTSFFLIPFLGFAQINSERNKAIDFHSETQDIRLFFEALGTQLQLGINYGNLPPHEVSSRSYSNKPLAYILEDVLREIGWHYTLLNDKSLVLRPINWDKPGPYSITGVCLEKESGNGLENVVVYSKYEPTVTRTNSIGYFQINLHYLPQDLHFYVPGQSLAKQNIPYDAHQTFIVAEISTASKLNEVLVKGESDTALVVAGANKTYVDVKGISQIPSALSSSGVVNALKYSTGFQSAVEANNALIVRGGNNDQNLVLFDGVPVYNPLHVPGWFSIFNKNSISSLNLLKGGIPAKFGGRLSSVIQSESKKGSLKKWHGNGTISPFAGEITLEGPIVKDKLSFIVSGRRTFTDFLVSNVQNLLLPESRNDFNLYFFDLNLGLHYQISPRTSVDLVSYFGGDRGYLRRETQVGGVNLINERNDNKLLWSNSLNSLSFKTVFGNRLVSDFAVKYSSYGFNYQNNYSIEISDEESNYVKRNEVQHTDGIQDIRLTSDFTFHPFSSFQLDFGAGYINYKFVPANTKHLQVVNEEALVDTSVVAQELQADEIFTYVEAKIQRGKSSFQLGTRAVLFQSDENYFYLEPRLKYGYYFNKKWSMHAAYNLLRQNVFSITANEPGIAYSIWLPINKGMQPLRVDQFELGLHHQVKEGPTLQLGAYHKSMSQLPDYQTNIIDFLTDKELTVGSGRAMGAELSVQQQVKKLTYWFSYSLAKSTRQFDQINDGKEFPFRFDRRHDLSLVASLKLKNDWLLGLTWIYNSGNYVTLPVSRVILKIDQEIFLIENFESRNNFKLPDYHRMDLGLSKTKSRKRGEQTWTFTLYNVYNQQNPYYVNLSFNEAGVPVLQSVNLLPLLPSIQYAFTF